MEDESGAGAGADDEDDCDEAGVRGTGDGGHWDVTASDWVRRSVRHMAVEWVEGRSWLSSRRDERVSR